ncbi:MAG: prolyl aminopeptidase [Alphaproteobacteria bacterium]|nr:prolyl aminopeptidase [Alphaproteobacteria bacterium]
MTDDPYPLFPPLEPFNSGHLAVDGRHRVYFEEIGKPDGKPVVFLHGGPGSGGSVEPRRFFDPGFYRAVLFDQRGCGRSTPTADITDNTTQHLIADIERLRRHLGIERWIVFGGSWGSTLSLAYAEAHPERCLALVIRGIWLARPQDLHWWFHSMPKIFPDVYRPFAAFIPEAERGDLLKAYHRRLIDPDPAVHLPAASVWKTYETSCATLLPEPDAPKDASLKTLSMSRVEAHYFVNDCFFEPNQLLRNLHRIRKIPCTIVHGRYDMICPVSIADELAQAWPEAEFHITQASGHSAFEPNTRRRLIETMERLKSLV